MKSTAIPRSIANDRLNYCFKGVECVYRNNCLLQNKQIYTKYYIMRHASWEWVGTNMFYLRCFEESWLISTFAK